MNILIVMLSLWYYRWPDVTNENVFISSEKVCMLYVFGARELFPAGSVSFAWKARIRSFDGCVFVSVICLFSFPYLYYLNKLSQFIIAWCYHRVSAQSATNIWGYPPRTDTIYLAEFFLHTICLSKCTTYTTVVYWKRTFSTLCIMPAIFFFYKRGVL